MSAYPLAACRGKTVLPEAVTSSTPHLAWEDSTVQTTEDGKEVQPD